MAKRGGLKKPIEKPELAPKEVVDLAEAIRSQHHQQLGAAKIAYVFEAKTVKRGGKVRLGTCRKQSDVSILVGKVDIIIGINKRKWLELDGKQRSALLDHEFCHVGIKLDKDTGAVCGYRLLPHDLEEFNAVVDRHGLWSRDVKMFAETTERQRQLLFAAVEQEA